MMPPDGSRDLRLDLLRGIANWAIFLDHIPDNRASWITMRHFGFSGASDLFVFISGWTATVAFGRAMSKQGFFAGASQIFQRVWQLYTAHVIVFVGYVVAVGDLARRFNIPDLTDRYNTSEVMQTPIEALRRGLILEFKPVYLDLLPLFIVLFGCFAPLLWLMLRRPNAALAGSFILYVLARHSGWNLPSWPEGVWPRNPFAWQFVFVLGAWFRSSGLEMVQGWVSGRRLFMIGGPYLVFALFMTLAGRFDSLGNILPGWLHDTFIPNDRISAAPYRVLHFVIIFLFVTRFISPDWPGLTWKVFDPLIKCGQHSLVVFCSGIFLSFFAWFALSLTQTRANTPEAVAEQIGLSLVGVGIMTLFAYYISWSKRLQETAPRRDHPF
jgi:hypothetical protein